MGACCKVALALTFLTQSHLAEAISGNLLALASAWAVLRQT